MDVWVDMRQPDHSRSGFTRIEVAVMLLLLLCFIGVVQGTPIIRDKARASETKQALHAIQLALERYATDHVYPGPAPYSAYDLYQTFEYPPYLLGGTRDFLDGHVLRRASEESPDPLIRSGYMLEYPMNPFAAKTKGLAQVQAATESAGDPLRSGTPEAALYGTRFGSAGMTMGNVLADPRHAVWDTLLPRRAKYEPIRTYADIEYAMWDMASQRDRSSYLPGQFFYKSFGRYNTDLLKDGDLTAGLSGEPDRLEVGAQTVSWPDTSSWYVLGAYGGVRQRGMDCLGEELPSRFSFSASDSEWLLRPEWGWQSHGMLTGDYSVEQDTTEILSPERHAWRPSAEQVEVTMWPWTRSQTGPHARQGCPAVLSGRPNGVADGVIMQLEGSLDKRVTGLSPTLPRLPRKPGRFSGYLVPEPPPPEPAGFKPTEPLKLDWSAHDR